MIPDLTNPLFPADRARRRGRAGAGRFSAWIVNTDNDPVREPSQTSSLRVRQVEGLIVATRRLHHPLLEQLHE